MGIKQMTVRLDCDFVEVMTGPSSLTCGSAAEHWVINDPEAISKAALPLC